jgi:hypothetical protein
MVVKQANALIFSGLVKIPNRSEKRIPVVFCWCKRHRLEAYAPLRRGVFRMGIARRAGKQCSIGFQPVSGRAARHPRKSLKPRNQHRLEGPFDALSLAQGTGIFTWTKRQAGSLCYIALRRVERYPNVILKALPRTQVMCRCSDLCIKLRVETLGSTLG